MSTNRCNLAAIFLCEILTVEKDEAFRLGRTTMFAIMPFYNLKLLGLISLDTIAMRHDDFFAMLDSRPAKTAPVVEPVAEDTQDAMACPSSKKAA